MDLQSGHSVVMATFALEYWMDEDWYVGRLKEAPGVPSWEDRDTVDLLLEAGAKPETVTEVVLVGVGFKDRAEW